MRSLSSVLDDPNSLNSSRCASAAEANGHPALGQQVGEQPPVPGHRRMVQVEQMMPPSPADALGLAGQVQSKQQGRGHGRRGVRGRVRRTMRNATDDRRTGGPGRTHHRGSPPRVFPRSLKMISQSDLEQSQVQCSMVKLLKAFRALLEPPSAVSYLSGNGDQLLTNERLFDRNLCVISPSEVPRHSRSARKTMKSTLVRM